MKRTLIAIAALAALIPAATAAEWNIKVKAVDLETGVITLEDGTELVAEGALKPGDFRPGDTIVLEVDDATGTVTNVTFGV